MTDNTIRDQLTERSENAPFLNSNGLPKFTSTPPANQWPFYIDAAGDLNFGYGIDITKIRQPLFSSLLSGTGFTTTDQTVFNDKLTGVLAGTISLSALNSSLSQVDWRPIAEKVMDNYYDEVINAEGSTNSLAYQLEHIVGLTSGQVAALEANTPVWAALQDLRYNANGVISASEIPNLNSDIKYAAASGDWSAVAYDIASNPNTSVPNRRAAEALAVLGFDSAGHATDALDIATLDKFEQWISSCGLSGALSAVQSVVVPYLDAHSRYNDPGTGNPTAGPVGEVYSFTMPSISAPSARPTVSYDASLYYNFSGGFEAGFTGDHTYLYGADGGSADYMSGIYGNSNLVVASGSYANYVNGFVGSGNSVFLQGDYADYADATGDGNFISASGGYINYVTVWGAGNTIYSSRGTDVVQAHGNGNYLVGGGGGGSLVAYGSGEYVFGNHNYIQGNYSASQITNIGGTINVIASYSNIRTGDENSTITGMYNGCYIAVGNGDNYINDSNGTGNYIVLGSGNNTVYLGYNDTVVGGSGYNTFVISNNNVTIRNYHSGDSLQFTGGCNLGNLEVTHSGTDLSIGDPIVIKDFYTNTTADSNGLYHLNAIFGASDPTDAVVDEDGNIAAALIESAASYTLGTNEENLTLTGSGDLVGTGNALNNTITGNSGVDTLVGGAGDDTYIIGNASDVITENASEGMDNVRSSVSYIDTYIYNAANDNIKRRFGIPATLLAA